MTLTITPAKLSGAVTPPPSKSQAHRLLLAAALAEGESVIKNVAPSQDMEATLRCLSALGASYTRAGDTVTLRGLGGRRPRGGGLPRLECGESGSTLRFLIPVALAVAGGGVFTGRGRLMERPQGPYFDIFKEKGIFYEQRDNVLTVRGELTPGEYRLPGNVSSQFVTGLLYALPLLSGDSRILPTTAVESWDYILMTLDALFGAGVVAEEPRAGVPYFSVHGGQTYQPIHRTVEPDWSQAAFWLAARAMGSPVAVRGMNEKSIQGDRVFLDWARMARGEALAGGVSVPILGTAPAKPLESAPSGGQALSIDVSQNPDLVPPLAAMGAVMNGTLYIKNAGRLRLKESDRLATVREELCKLGAQVAETPDSLVIQGAPSLPGGGAADSHNDHRIAMMVAIAATRCQRPLTLTGAEAVDKSYPTFWEDYVNLGGQIARR